MAASAKKKKTFTLLSSARYGPRPDSEPINDEKFKNKGEVDIKELLKKLKSKRETLCSICDKEPVTRRCYPCKCANTCERCCIKAYKRPILAYLAQQKKTEEERKKEMYCALPSCITCDKDVSKTKRISQDKLTQEVKTNNNDNDEHSS